MAKKEFKDDEKKRKGYKPRSSRKPNRKVSDEREDKTGLNDINWWIQDSMAGKQAAAIPFVYPTGINTFAKTATESPVLMKLFTRCVPGINDGPNSPFNQQMRKVTANMVQKLGGSGEANAANVGLYLLGIGNIYAFIAYCKRIYGTIKLFTPENIFMPQGMVYAHGMDVTDLRTNAQALRVAINYWIDRINSSFAMPNDMGFVKRWEQLLGNYYSDFQSLKGQIYMYDCSNFYIYDEANSKLVATSIPNTGTGGTTSVADLIAFGDSMLYPFMESENMNMVSARIRRAWTDLYGVDNMDEFYIAPVAYAPEILYEIHNTTVTGGIQTANGAADITEVVSGLGTSYISNSLELVDTTQWIGDDYQYIDVPLPVDNVTPELVMLGSRGLVTEERVVDDQQVAHIYIRSCGTDIVTTVFVYGWDENQQLQVYNIFGASRRHLITFSAANFTATALAVSVLTKFDWSPVFTWVNMSQNKQVCQVADTTYVGLLPDTQIKMLHRTALASAFNARDVQPGSNA